MSSRPSPQEPAMHLSYQSTNQDPKSGLCSGFALGLFNMSIFVGLCLIALFSFEFPETGDLDANSKSSASRCANWHSVYTLQHSNDQKTVWVLRHGRNAVSIDVATGRCLDEVESPAGS